jgi:phospholipid/cholesterol/gamma-HCH transport system ATP-binding protein
MIVIRSLMFKRGDKVILRDINLDVEHGTVLAIMGMSGCGKSTLLRLIAGLEKPSQGEIFISGTDISTLRERDLERIRQSIGFVFQGAALFDYLSVYENVSFPLRRHTAMDEKEIRHRVADRLALVGLEGTEDLMPAELSGGMRKRAGLARAINMEPAPLIVLYDEPTGGLDPIMTAVINDLIVRVRDELDVTSVLVTHDMANLHFVDQAAMIHNGIVEAVGSPAELMATTNPVVDQFIHGRSKGPIDVVDAGAEL